MSKPTRRTVLKRGVLAGAAFSCGLTPAWSAQQAAEPALAPDLALVNGNVYTVDDRRPQAQAFAVRDGRFVAVGSNAEINKLISGGTQVIDADGMTVVPGFIDAHTHPAEAGVSELLVVNCDRRTIAEIKEAIRQRAGKTPAGEWVFGFKYDDTKLKDERPLTRADLDEAAPQHPVRVTHRGGHTAIVNSRRLERAGITRDTPDPEGGKFGRDAQGELTGFVAERALELLDRGRRHAVDWSAAAPGGREADLRADDRRRPDDRARRAGDEGGLRRLSGRAGRRRDALPRLHPGDVRFLRFAADRRRAAASGERVAAHRRPEALLRRLRLRADHAHEPALRRPAQTITASWSPRRTS